VFVVSIKYAVHATSSWFSESCVSSSYKCNTISVEYKTITTTTDIWSIFVASEDIYSMIFEIIWWVEYSTRKCFYMKCREWTSVVLSILSIERSWSEIFVYKRLLARWECRFRFSDILCRGVIISISAVLFKCWSVIPYRLCLLHYGTSENISDRLFCWIKYLYSSYSCPICSIE